MSTRLPAAERPAQGHGLALEPGLPITIVSGSHRQASESARVAQLVRAILARRLDVADPTILDLGRNPLPLWSEDLCRPESDPARAWAPVSARLRESGAFVFVTPEWGGMAPPALKNLFLLCDESDELADKPALIVSVSSGRGGAYAVAELRASSYKNTRVCYIPEQVVIHDVGTLFRGEELVDSEAAYSVERRLVHALALLVRYAEALVSVRCSGVRDLRQFPWGM